MRNWEQKKNAQEILKGFNLVLGILDFEAVFEVTVLFFIAAAFKPGNNFHL